MQEVVERLRAVGVSIEVRENGSSFVAGELLLALWRDGGPAGTDDKPLYFEAALVAMPGYYDFGGKGGTGGLSNAPRRFAQVMIPQLITAWCSRY